MSCPSPPSVVPCDRPFSGEILIMNATFPADRPGPERLPDAGRSTTHDFLAESFPADDPADGSWFASAGFELPDDELPRASAGPATTRSAS